MKPTRTVERYVADKYDVDIENVSVDIDGTLRVDFGQPNNGKRGLWIVGMYERVEAMLCNDVYEDCECDSAFGLEY